jgi:hypothetical protein
VQILETGVPDCRCLYVSDRHFFIVADNVFTIVDRNTGRHVSTFALGSGDWYQTYAYRDTLLFSGRSGSLWIRNYDQADRMVQYIPRTVLIPSDLDTPFYATATELRGEEREAKWVCQDHQEIRGVAYDPVNRLIYVDVRSCTGMQRRYVLDATGKKPLAGYTMVPRAELRAWRGFCFMSWANYTLMCRGEERCKLFEGRGVSFAQGQFCVCNEKELSVYDTDRRLQCRWELPIHCDSTCFAPDGLTLSGLDSCGRIVSMDLG